MELSSNLDQSTLRLGTDLQRLLACPACRSPLAISADECRCTGEKCRLVFPSVNGIPVLIHEATSIFSLDDFRSHRDTTFRPASTLRRAIRQNLPYLTRNYKARENFRRITRLLTEHNPAPRVLVIGGSTMGAGIDELLACPALQVVETDVSFGPRTGLICDAHDLPFADRSFDAVIIQAVLNCVADPYRCVDEAHRVLKDDGLIYTETSFLQPVLDGRYDFTRFTHLGYLRLFRRYERIESGTCGGPAMAIALLYRSFLLSLVNGRIVRKGVGIFATLSAFWFKYIDYFLLDRPATLDCTSGCYFLGRRSEHTLSDRELIRMYRGALDEIGSAVVAGEESPAPSGPGPDLLQHHPG
jgi:uncharacterized protein YbaR (Trm112 family)/SAM-dependent methyltransferase